MLSSSVGAFRPLRSPLAAFLGLSIAIACSSDPGTLADRLQPVGDQDAGDPNEGDSPASEPGSPNAEDGGTPAVEETPIESGDSGANDEPETDESGTTIEEPPAPDRENASAGAGGLGNETPSKPGLGDAGAPSNEGGSAGAVNSGGTAGIAPNAGGFGGKSPSAGGAAGRDGTSGFGGAGGSGGNSAGAAAGGAPVSTGGAATSGAGGSSVTGGTGQIPGEACSACGSDECAAQFSRCQASRVCSDWLDCVSACTNDACTRACDETYRDAVLLTAPIYQCLCSRCSNECSGLEVCGQRCEEGAAPPAPTSTAPASLSDTGLYGRNGRIAPYVRRYRPEYELFSDSAVKERFIYLPRCSQIDTRDMDHWNFPVGTRLWKQFTRDGVRIETRMLARYGRGVGEWVMTSYQWPLPASGSAALTPAQATRASDSGVSNVNGTAADIPSLADCRFCHERLTDRALGFGAIQLSHDLDGVTFMDLVDWGVLSNAPVRTGYDPPGDATARAALGYLHANCGGCHNDTGVRVSMYLRLLVDQSTVESTSVYTTSVNVRTGNSNFRMDRIEPGDPSQSAIIARMLRDPSAGETQQMPPLGRELVHTEGVSAVSAWIRSLPR